MNKGNIKQKIMQFNRQPQLSAWFDKKLDEAIGEMYKPYEQLNQINESLVNDLVHYRTKYNKHTVAVGMSGGIDSALTASLFKKAGYRVLGVTMPIYQKEEETDRGVEACQALDLDHRHIDLSEAYDSVVDAEAKLDASILRSCKHGRIKKGNIRARLRMITLYNLASASEGFVGSTDNFSELAAGFWTLHGDVGDVAPIQSLWKSWEVPALAEINGVPSSIIEAVPTDGLGVSTSDEDQFGFSYLEFDLALNEMLHHLEDGKHTLDISKLKGKKTDEDLAIIENVISRVGGTAYKRFNPLNLNHPMDHMRFKRLEDFDSQF